MKLSSFFSLHAANAVMFEETYMRTGRGRSRRLQSSQDDAQAYCERQGGNLVFFKTEGEFTTFANEYAKWKPVRVGYTRDNTTDPFRAITSDTDVYTRFNDDELPDRETCLLLAKTQRKKFTNKKMFPANCDNKKMSWCRYEEDQNSVRNGDFSKYKVAEIIANAHDAEAYCEAQGGHLPYLTFGRYNDEVNLTETLNGNQWTGLKRSAESGRAGSIVDKLNRDRTIAEDSWLTDEPSQIDGHDCIELAKNEDGALKWKMQDCEKELPFVCRYNKNDCNKSVVSAQKPSREQLPESIGFLSQLQDLKCSGSNEWEISVSFKCKHDNTELAEDIVLIKDNDNPSIPFARVHRRASDYFYDITMPKMSESTTVYDEYFNPFPGHIHVQNKESQSPMYTTYLCGRSQRGSASLQIVQKFCKVSGTYTKSLFWNGFERMRFTDTVPTVMKNLEFFMGGNSAENPTRIHWYSANERENWESNCDTDQERDCVKPDNTTVPYGYAEWEHPMKNGNRKAGLCYCFTNGNYKCVKENMKDA